MGDRDALDLVLISEAFKTGSVIEIIPIGVLKLIDNNEYDYEIIAVPVDKKLRIVNAIYFKELKLSYPKILNILELWFLYYDNGDSLETEVWGDEKESLLEITKAMK